MPTEVISKPNTANRAANGPCQEDEKWDRVVNGPPEDAERWERVVNGPSEREEDREHAA